MPRIDKDPKRIEAGKKGAETKRQKQRESLQADELEELLGEVPQSIPEEVELEPQQLQGRFDENT